MANLGGTLFELRVISRSVCCSLDVAFENASAEVGNARQQGMQTSTGDEVMVVRHKGMHRLKLKSMHHLKHSCC